jgi:ankyrin repeat protein
VACGDRPLITALQLSPLSFVGRLLELGADPNYDAPDGFPPLIGVIDVDRPDKIEAMRLLLDHGADVGQRGINDWTVLHYAVVRGNLEAVKLLIEHGADPTAATRIDDFTSPLEDARAMGFTEAVTAMGG